MRKSALFAATVAAVALMSLPAYAQQQWTKVYKVAGKPDIHIETNDAAIEVTSSDSMQISARVVANGYNIGSDGVRIEKDSQDGNRVDLEVRVPRSSWSWGTNSRGVRIELVVPRNADLQLHTGDGHVRCRGVSGNLQIETSDGSIDVSELRGSMRLHTGDGHIEGMDLDGALDASTNDGHVRVRGRFDALQLQTGDGSVTADVLPGSKMSSNWTVRTSDGSVTLRLSDGLAADIEAHTGDGSISSQLPLMVSGVLGRQDLRGKLAGGGPTLQIRTGDGSIHLERL